MCHVLHALYVGHVQLMYYSRQIYTQACFGIRTFVCDLLHGVTSGIQALGKFLCGYFVLASLFVR